MSHALVRLIGWPATILHGDTTVVDRWGWLRRHLRPGPLRTLDAGCGAGAFTMYAARRGNQAVGVAFDARDIRAAAERAALLRIPAVRFIAGDLRRLDEFGPALGDFDQVLLFETIEHIRDDRKLLADLAARLVPGGRLLLTAPSKHHHALWGERVSAHEDGGHVRWGYTHQELRELFGRCGLEVLSEEYISGLVSQTIASLTFGLRRINLKVAWAATLPLRIFHPLDLPLTRLTRYPYLSIGVVGRKPTIESA
jgi:SAM-dependent methyltransferase